jgi:hypothetical protein
MKRTVKVCVLVVGLLAMGAWARAERAVNEHKAVNADAVIEVSNVAGSIAVDAWTKNELEVTGTIGDDVERLDVTGGADRASVRVILPQMGNNHDGQARLTLHVPAGCHLVTDGVSADTTVTGLKGMVEAKTVSGGITVKGSPSSVEAKTVSGDVHITADAAKMRIQSVSGDVVLGGATSDLNVHTVSGDVTASGASLKNMEMQTTSGDVGLDASLAKAGRATIQTLSGDVAVALPSGTSAAVEVKTMSGDITNAFGPKAERQSEYGPGKHLGFKIGGGDGRITITTMSGDVQLKQK